MKPRLATPYVVSSVDDGIMVVTLSRPAKLNAWDSVMRSQVGALLEHADGDPEVRAVVLTGSGPDGFCAGADLQEVATHTTPELTTASLVQFRRFYRQILQLGKPFVAALAGVAAGSGFQAALMADFRVAHEGVTMGQPEILSGIPSITGTTLMMRRLGTAVAGELALTGRLMDAPEALRLGLLSRIVPREDVLPESIALARELGALSPEAFRQTKAWLRREELLDMEAAYDFAEQAQARAVLDGDMTARVTAFLHGRRHP